MARQGTSSRPERHTYMTDFPCLVYAPLTRPVITLNNISYMKTHKLKLTIATILIIALGFIGPYKYNNHQAVAYATKHKHTTSRCMCAWYVMKALRSAGCHHCYIYPAYAYNKTLPKMGFRKIPVENYVPQKGDISVLPKNPGSPFGHIAIYNGKHWVSDYEQKSIFPNSQYKQTGKYEIFRIEDGWHWTFLYHSPHDIYEYIKSFVVGYKKIKFFS